MKNPNNYGTIVNLGKGRRRPLGVRVRTGVKLTDDYREIPQFKYIGYFENTAEGKKAAIQLLAEYNQGRTDIKPGLVKKPTFLALANEWLDRHEMSLNTRNSDNIDSNISHYKASLNKCSAVFDKQIDTISFKDVQEIADSVSTMGKSSVMKLKTLINGTFDLARKSKYIPENFIPDIDFNYARKTDSIHTPFTEKEIEKLWSMSQDREVKALLVMIYTGFRCQEFLRLKNENIYLNDRYLVGGMKTNAGRDRIVPIHEKIVPFIEYFLSDDQYFFNNQGKMWTYSWFLIAYWNPLMKRLNMEHLPHDTRYTCASLLDRANANPNCIKDILGHAREGITNQVYVKKNIQDLIAAINLIIVPVHD